MEATAGVSIFAFLTYNLLLQTPSSAQMCEGSAKIWSDTDCPPTVPPITTCQDEHCCKAACKAKDKCTAVNFKPGDCVLRDCKCMMIKEPTWENEGYKGYRL